MILRHGAGISFFSMQMMQP